MLGRSKLAMKRRAVSSLSSVTISSRVRSSAVAVSAMRGTRGEPLGENLELAVFGTEVVAPLGDAVRLVDGEQRQLRAREQRQRPLLQQPLGRDIEDIEAARGDAAFERRLLAIVERRVEERGPDADLGQRLHLVLHQRDQRRDDDAGAGSNESRDLVAQRLAAAGRHQRQRIAAGDHGGDDVGLMRAELPEPEHVGQHLLRAIGARAVERDIGPRHIGLGDLARRGGRHRPLAL